MLVGHFSEGMQMPVLVNLSVGVEINFTIFDRADFIGCLQCKIDIVGNNNIG